MNSIKKKVALAGVCLTMIVGVGATATTASASHSWSWTPKAAANTLVDDGLEWTDGTFDEVVYAKCRGVGSSYVRNGLRFFKHFNCAVRTDFDDVYVLAMHITGKYSYGLDLVSD